MNPYASKRPNFGGQREASPREDRLPFGGFRENRQFWVLTGWLAVVFLFGGSSRVDSSSLLLLYPLSVILLAYAVFGLSWDHVKHNRFLFGLAALILGLPLLQLLPLPHAIWSSLPGRDLIVAIDAQAGASDVWRPLSMAPRLTESAFWSLIAPVATLVLAVQLSNRQRIALVSSVLAIGVMDVLISAIQLFQGSSSVLYLHRITSRTLPVGLFANRNHQGLFLAIVLILLAFWSVKSGFFRGMGRHLRKEYLAGLITLGGAAILLPLVLVTGSRSGTMLAVAALLLTPFFVFGGSKEGHISGAGRKIGISICVALVLLGAMVAVAYGEGQAVSLIRLGEQTATEDMRLLILPTLIEMISTYMPWGTGFGSFETVYKVSEPDALLRGFYMNQAHNDWLDLALTGGVPALVLVALAGGGFAVRLYNLFRAGSAAQGFYLALAGAATLVLMALASITDYPLRLPSLMCLAAVAMVWLVPAKSGSTGLRSSWKNSDD